MYAGDVCTERRVFKTISAVLLLNAFCLPVPSIRPLTKLYIVEFRVFCLCTLIAHSFKSISTPHLHIYCCETSSIQTTPSASTPTSPSPTISKAVQININLFFNSFFTPSFNACIYNDMMLVIENISLASYIFWTSKEKPQNSLLQPARQFSTQKRTYGSRWRRKRSSLLKKNIPVLHVSA